MAAMLGRCMVLLAPMVLAACAPAFPVLKKESELTLAVASTSGQPPTTTVVEQRVCVLNGEGQPSAPLECLQAARDELVGLQNSAGHFQRAMGLTAVAGGSYAGYQAVRPHVNQALLKHAAVGLATLVGINQAVDADGQMTAIGAGIDALDCVRRAADTVAGTKSEDLQSELESFSSNARQFQSMQVDQNASPAQAFAAQVATVRAADVTARSRAYVAAATAAQRLAPAEIYDAVVAIRQKVRQSIVGKTVNLKDIYQAQQKAVASMVGDLAAKEKGQQDAAMAFDLTNTSGGEPGKTPVAGSGAQQTLAACGIPGAAN